MAWRRKPDGRPYADVFIDGVRRRLSLLHPGEVDISDEVATARYRVLLAAIGRESPQQNGRRINSLDRLFSWYCDVVMAARNNRASTISQNRTIFARITQFFSGRGVKTVDDLAARPDVIDEYVVWRKRLCKPSSVNRDLGKVRAAFRAAAERNVIPAPPIRQWPHLKLADPGYPEPLSKEDFARLLKSMRNTTAYNPVRFIAWTGCRPVDACNLQRANIHGLDTEEPVAVIRQQKTGRNVAIALNPPAIEAIKDELARGIRSAYVFTRKDGTQHTAGAICVLVRYYAERLGIQKTVKAFRQSLVSRLYDAGADDLLVRRITGHQSDSIRAYRQLRRGAAHELSRSYADIMLGENEG